MTMKERKKNQDLNEVCIVPNHFCYYRPDVVYTTKKKKKTVFLLLQSQPSLTLYVFKTAPCFFVFGVVKGFVFISSAVSQKKKTNEKDTLTQERKKYLVCLKLFGLFCVSFSLSI